CQQHGNWPQLTF
nr:immunoglobulin light chain junction region [Macaca mulatta]MPN90862.1 immunoglobulin light chain junction region [Macaca mulatta]MPN90907.1 immunoglobulin light chain junction region [Macaca mulatta]MPN90912.1 immunoglobulin light chain junction region [Macaca mulatta]MPN90927.1 immunoglobulin light chain junction region [Macaca mulatta]